MGLGPGCIFSGIDDRRKTPKLRILMLSRELDPQLRTPIMIIRRSEKSLDPQLRTPMKTILEIGKVVESAVTDPPSDSTTNVHDTNVSVYT